MPLPTTQNPILIIDKHGILGEILAKYLSQVQLVVFVSRKVLQQNNIVFIPYGTQIPRIPNNIFSQIIVIDISDIDFPHFLPALLRKATQSKTQIIFLKNVYRFSSRFLQRFLDIGTPAKLILYGDVFSQETVVSESLKTIFQHAKENQTIVLANSGLNLCYPMYLSDLLQEFYKLLFSSDSGIYSLFPKSGISHLTITRILHSHNPELKLHLKNSKEKQNLLIPSGLTELTTVSQVVGQLEKIKIDEVNFKVSLALEVEEIKHRHYLSKLRQGLIIGVLTFVMLLIIPLIFALLGLATFTSSINQLDKGKINMASQLATISKQSFLITQAAILPIDILGQTISLPLNSLNNNLAIIQKSSSILQNITGSVGLVKTQPDLAIAKLRFGVQEYDELISDHALSFIPSNKQLELNNLSNGFSYLSDSLETLLSGSRTYLVLLLNSNELRPAGGFIGSYGLLNIKNGEIQVFSLHDIYDLDGQLQGHVDPPAALTQYLGLQHWFLRDSNFYADLNQDAKTENYFYTLESGKKVDGIISVDTDLLANLLAITGPINVSDYNQKVDENNYFQILEDHAEKNFIPGSQQKKAFLSSFANALSQKLSQHPLSLSVVEQLIVFGLKEKHLQINSNNLFINQALQNSLLNLISPAQADSETIFPTLNDFFGVNEANLGVNKVNHYLKRSIQHDISIDDQGEVTHNVTITYDNTSNAKSSYGGDYKVFVRILIPTSAALNTIVINGETKQFFLTTDGQQPTYKGQSFLASESMPVFNEDAMGEESYGFFSIIPESSTRKISVSYTLGQNLNPALANSRYQLYLYKQQGTGADNVTVNLDADPALHSAILDNSTAQNKTYLQFILNQDRLITFQ